MSCLGPTHCWVDSRVQCTVYCVLCTVDSSVYRSVECTPTAGWTVVFSVHTLHCSHYCVQYCTLPLHCRDHCTGLCCILQSAMSLSNNPVNCTIQQWSTDALYCKIHLPITTIMCPNVLYSTLLYCTSLYTVLYCTAVCHDHTVPPAPRHSDLLEGLPDTG